MPIEWKSTKFRGDTNCSRGRKSPLSRSRSPELSPRLESAVSKPEREISPYSKIERWGAATGHASLLLVGLPISLILLSPPWSLLFCPVLPYLIGRSFRRRGMTWGAYQGMQASVAQLLILVMGIMAFLTSGLQSLSGLFIACGFFLFLYSLWGALDTWLGDDFQYIGISRLLENVSRRNMGRQEVRRRWFSSGSSDRNNRGNP